MYFPTRELRASFHKKPFLKPGKGLYWHEPLESVGVSEPGKNFEMTSFHKKTKCTYT